MRPGNPRQAFLQSLGADLATLDELGLSRRLALPRGIDFSSNDYLGLGQDPDLWQALTERARRAMAAGRPLAAPASRLLRGTTADHLELEERFADFKGAEASLLFPSGYQANVGLLSTLVTGRDHVLTDSLNHASLIDGLRMSRCRKSILPHADLNALEAGLKKASKEKASKSSSRGHTFVLVESLYSMDGDLPDLLSIVDLAERHGAVVLVDEAHATGLYGERGSGRLEELALTDRVLAATSTGGKSLGASGAFVTGPRQLIDTLINRCRPFIFSTAVPPLLVWALAAALDQLATELEKPLDQRRRARCLEQSARLRQQLSLRGIPVGDDESPIVPVRIGGNERAMAVAEIVQARGFDVRAVRPPTVPQGTARLRLSVHANHRDEEIVGLAKAIAEAIQEVPESEPSEAGGVPDHAIDDVSSELDSDPERAPVTAQAAALAPATRAKSR